MMDTSKTLAYLFLHAVLPRLEELVKLDDEAAGIAKELNFSLKFVVRDGPSIVLNFDQGTVTSTTEIGAKSDLGLYFVSCEQLNNQFLGKKAIPIPYKGFTKLPAMKKFSQLTDLMERYLKPSDEDLQSDDFKKKHVEMSLKVGMNGAGVVAKHDPSVKRIADHLPDGTMQFSVLPDGPHVHAIVEGKNILVRSGEVPDPTSTLAIANLALAVDVLADKVDTMAALGAGDLMVSGLLPLTDEFNALVARAGYLLA